MTDYTSAEFWAGAPEGATHYSRGEPGKECSAFWREQGGRLVEFWGIYKEGEITHATNPAGYAKTPAECIPRPTTQLAAWNGEGLPPVGVKCEVFWPQDTHPAWYDIEVMYVGKRNAIVLIDGEEENYLIGDFYNKRAMFRPARTPEQVASCEREAYIKRMRECVNDFERDRDDDFGRLYDHGLRFKDDAK